jgi:flagellar protein FlgJ
VISSSTFSPTQNSDSYTDLSNLQSITKLGRTDKNQALGKVAQQFESMMVRMMMKSMRDANSVFAEGNFLSSDEGDTYQGMFDDQLALSLSQGRGMGVAETMIRQLQSRFGTSQNTVAQPVEKTVSSYLNTRNTETGPVPGAVAASYAAGKISSVAAAHQPMKFDGSVAEFTENLFEMAKGAAEKLGVEPDILLAQAALETGWGKKISASGDRSSLNLFNIKADKRWSGDSIKVATMEVRDGLAVKEVAAFRAYRSAEHSFNDYVDFIANSPRYEGALQSDNSDAYIRNLSAAGYATDPDYADKVLRIANSENFRTAINHMTQLSELSVTVE